MNFHTELFCTVSELQNGPLSVFYYFKIVGNDLVKQHIINWPITTGSGAFILILELLPVAVQTTELLELNPGDN